MRSVCLHSTLLAAMREWCSVPCSRSRWLPISGVAPFAGAFVHLVPRRVLLVALDVVRAMVALALPFVTEAWHLYVLIFVLQSRIRRIHTDISGNNPGRAAG